MRWNPCISVNGKVIMPIKIYPLHLQMDLYQRIRLIPDLLPETVTSWLRSYLLIQILPAQDLFFCIALFNIAWPASFAVPSLRKLFLNFPTPPCHCLGLLIVKCFIRDCPSILTSCAKPVKYKQYLYKICTNIRQLYRYGEKQK
jgi:hypothetical protein